MKAIPISILILLLIAGSSAGSAATVEQPGKVDEFSFIRCDDELMRMFHYRDFLNAHPNATAYVIVYGGRRDKRDAADAHASRLKDLLTNSLGISAQRSVVILGGYREQWTVELWASPPDTTKPIPTPTLKANEVRFRKGKSKPIDFKWNCV